MSVPVLKYFCGFLQMGTKLSQVQLDFPRDFMILGPWLNKTGPTTFWSLNVTCAVKGLILCDLLSYLGREWSPSECCNGHVFPGQSKYQDLRSKREALCGRQPQAVQKGRWHPQLAWSPFSTQDPSISGCGWILSLCSSPTHSPGLLISSFLSLVLSLKMGLQPGQRGEA